MLVPEEVAMHITEQNMQFFLTEGVACVAADKKLFEASETVTQTYARFLQEPADFLKPWINLEQYKGDPETGLLPRRGERKHDKLKGGYDWKDTFHYRPSIYRALAKSGGVLGLYESWLKQQCNPLLNECMSVIKHFAETLDHVLPGFEFQTQFLMGWDGRRKICDRHALRINRYLPGNKIELGKAHIDRCTFTINVAENYPGLEIYSPTKKKWQPVELLPGKVYILAGEKLSIITKGIIPPCKHRIRNLRPGNVRWSVVGFGNTPTPIDYREKALRS
jgi:hypothetical protein